MMQLKKKFAQWIFVILTYYKVSVQNFGIIRASQKIDKNPCQKYENFHFHTFDILNLYFKIYFNFEN